MMSTHINENVLEFYKGLPFNYRDNIEEHALSIIKKTRWAGRAHEMLTPFLSVKQLSEKVSDPKPTGI